MTPAATASAATSVPEYEKLTGLLREISALNSASGVLAWDEMTEGFPPGAAVVRAQQKAALAGVVHEKSVSTDLGDAIKSCEKVSDQIDCKFSQANIRDARLNYDRGIRVTKELAMEKEAAESEGFAAWQTARKEDDFAGFAPIMKNGLRVFKEYVKATRPDMEPYDAAIDVFERGMTADRLQELFDELAVPLKSLLDRVDAAGKNEIHPSLKGGEGWDIDAQNKLCSILAEKIGFDFNNGRLDKSAHPFSIGMAPEDVRITTRYSKDNPFGGIMGLIHETGHALYEQGLSKEQYGLPVHGALSMGAHESQSLFWERMVALQPAFWKSVLPIVHEQLPVTKDATAEEFNVAVNQVNKRGLIRVDSDELSYPFHIMIRFEIEKGLFDGSIEVEDLSRVWKEKMKKYLDIDVENDADGCLQDVHWPTGGFGYFPTYSLGAMTAAQLYSFMDREALPGMEGRIEEGKFDDIKLWLNENFHKKGSLYPSLDELLIAVTGEPLKITYFIEYLEKKYTALYNLK